MRPVALCAFLFTAPLLPTPAATAAVPGQWGVAWAIEADSAANGYDPRVAVDGAGFLEVQVTTGGAR